MTYSRKDAAERYDFARELPDETLTLWMNRIQRLVPTTSVSRALDLGGGTGRFAGPIQKLYKCPLIVMDPSEAMLKQGVKRKMNGTSWICGVAEHIPLCADSMDLVWMCQVFHHLEDPQLAFLEVYRVLKPGGYLAIRNGTQENDMEIEWSHCFPEAQQIDRMRIPSQSQVVNTVSRHGFIVLEVQTVYQFFASTYTEYYNKIAQRGLSSLINISDKAFNTGLRRLKEWTSNQPQDRPVYEPVDLFVFSKR